MDLASGKGCWFKDDSIEDSSLTPQQNQYRQFVGVFVADTVEEAEPDTQEPDVEQEAATSELPDTSA